MGVAFNNLESPIQVLFVLTITGYFTTSYYLFDTATTGSLNGIEHTFLPCIQVAIRAFTTFTTLQAISETRNTLILQVGYRLMYHFLHCN